MGLDFFLVYETSDLIEFEIDLSEFNVQVVNITDGCCAPRFANSTQEVDPKTLTRCLPCNRALGVNGTLPENARWKSPDDCSWECNPTYEMQEMNSQSGVDIEGNIERNVECVLCVDPGCLTGNYWTDCETCAPCDALPSNAYFMGPGHKRRDSSSCPIRCNTPYYAYETINNTQCARCTDITELDCKNVSKKMGNFYERACSTTHDARCINCLICAPGFNTSIPCGKDYDTVCTQCDASLLRIPELSTKGGAEWRLTTLGETDCQWQCTGALQYNPHANTCFMCNADTCDVGFYPVECTQHNDYMGCSSCVAPTNAVMVSVGVMSRNNSCLWECAHNHEYNNTLNSCVPQPVIQAPTIDVLTPDVHCSGTRCGWGYFFDTTFDLDPCEAMCSRCPNMTNINTVYIRKSSCEWVCAYPYLLNEGVCVTLD